MGEQVQEVRGQGLPNTLDLDSWVLPGCRAPGQAARVVGEAMWPGKEPRTVLRRSASSSALLRFVQCWVTMMHRIQETMRRKGRQDLGMWEVSILVARGGNGTEASSQEQELVWKC